MLRKASREGFTLVELSLSMVFISILSISIVVIINNTLSAYRRGITLSQINTTGMELMDDMRAAVQGSSMGALVGSCTTIYSGANETNCKSDNAYGLVLVKKTTEVTINGEVVKNVPIFGAFCTGKYSYIWNSGYFESDNADFTEKTNKIWARLTYTSSEKDEEGNYKVKTIDSSIGDENRPFRLLKVEDESRGVCVAAMDGYNKNKVKEVEGKIDIDVSSIIKSMENEPEDILIADGNNNLAIYDLDVAQPVKGPGTNTAFYSGSFILGTISGGINVMALGNACAAPTDYDSKDFENFDYCAINKFNFAVQVNGGKK